MEIKKGKEKEGAKQDYFRWDLVKERELANVLRDQRSLGRKGDNGWKTVALNAAATVLSTTFKTQITTTNIRNCLRTWKKIYATVSDILSQSGFDWDGTKQMITVDNENAWIEYVKSHDDAKNFRWKVIPNWEDIVDLCAKDRATGEGAETASEANEVMDLESMNDMDTTSTKDGQDDTISTSSTQSAKRKGTYSSTEATSSKKGGSSSLATAVLKMASSFEKFMEASSNVKLDPKDVYEEVFGVDGLEENQKMKACVWFVENEKQFALLKSLPMEKKKGFILMLI